MAAIDKSSLFNINPVRERLLLGLLVLIGSFSFYALDIGWVNDLRERMEWMAYDLRMRATGLDAAIVDSRVIVLDIDDDSLEQLGRWPWSRTQMAELIAKLTEAEAAVIALDIFFSEPERNPLIESSRLLQTAEDKDFAQMAGVLEQLAEVNDADKLLGEVMAAGPIVQGYVASGEKRSSSGAMPEPAGLLAEQQVRVSLPTIESYIANIGVIGEGKRGGFLTFQPDRDGILRRVPLVLSYKDAIYPSLALAAVMEYMGLEKIDLITAPAGDGHLVEGLSIDGALNLPTDHLGRANVPFPKRAGAFHYVSAVDFLAGRFDENLVRDAIVLVGSTATGIYDLRATPISGIYPGVEVHAVLMSAMLNDYLPYAAKWAQGVDIVSILLLGLIAALAMPFIGIGWVVLLMLVMDLGFIYLNFWLWQEKRLILSLAMPVLLVALIGIANLVIGFYHEMMFRKRLRTAFGQYIPPELVDQLQDDSSAAASLEGEEREMTVLFSDIRGFTGISESLRADQLKQLLNLYFTPMTRIIFERKGTIDKYVGDMIMAFWGAPVEDKDHRQHAIEAALDMLQAIENLQPRLRQLGFPEVHSGIGLNSGPMNVGDMGSEYRRAYTVLGDAVNLGSRLEGLTKYYGVPLIVSAETAAGLEQQFLFRPLDRVRVKGKDKPVNILQPLCHLKQASPDQLAEVEAFRAAYSAYLEGDWYNAQQRLQALIAAHPAEKLYRVYHDRIDKLQEEHADSSLWDSTFVHEIK
ncbi:MAG: adenylate/guanylate cyclase domain-containing protein [Gammaproteobacteria bacterium]|nr:adenylate/guanylate cyclase domain-containing protein [Gammaproteobacteria bacterium]